MINSFRELCLNTYGVQITEKLDLAISLAQRSLEGKTRYDGSPFIGHSIGVAVILIKDLHMGLTAVYSAILHDVVRIDPTLMPNIKLYFGDRVYDTLMGMNNISSVETNNNRDQVENFKELIVSYSTNPRIILLKIADRLEVMQSLDSFPREKRERKAWESLHIYSQIAHKLGLYGIKTEMEEIALRHLEPQEYLHIQKKLEETESQQADFIDRFSAPIIEKLTSHNLKFTLSGRTKSIYSIWKKMKKQKIAFEDVYDISAIRVVLDVEPQEEKAACWLSFSIVTEFYKPNPERMRDWISIPKSNGYESLHATVVSLEGKWVEVQIRSKRMDEVAECGIAAHWKYKGVKDNKEWLERLREVIENVKIDGDTLAFDSEIDTSTKEVFVFTPNGDIRKLPLGSTILDFAYDIHTNIGNHCVGGKINNKNVTIKETLSNGDLVEIKTQTNQVPRADWLSIVVTSKAKSRIKTFLRDLELKRTEATKEELERKIKNWKLEISLDNAVNILCKYYKVKNGAELYSQLDSGEISILETKDILTKFISGELTLRVTDERAPKEKSVNKTGANEVLMVDSNISDLKYNFAKCCNPIYGDSIKGFITVLNGITIHQSDCVNLTHLEERYPYRILSAKWSDNRKGGLFMAKIKMSGEVRIHGVEDIVYSISKDLNIIIRNIKSSTNQIVKSGLEATIYETEVQVEVPNENLLNSMILLLKDTKLFNRVFKL